MGRIKALFLTGRHIHDWRRTTAFYWYLLENTGRFEVTVAAEADAALQDGSALAGYQLLIDDYRGADWSRPAQINFEQFVARGGGLVVVHAAAVVFKGWAEFEAMAPLLWRTNGDHSRYHEFPVKIVDRDHPITADQTMVAIDNPLVRTTFVRGCEWAATGDVATA